ncbi:MAG: hypothetical protein PVJ21_19110 [Anaerolineales bacterium]
MIALTLPCVTYKWRDETRPRTEQTEATSKAHFGWRWDRASELRANTPALRLVQCSASVAQTKRMSAGNPARLPRYPLAPQA